MKFKIDENLPAEIADDVRAAGHEADTVTGQGMAGAEDPLIMAKVQYEGRVFLTLDKGIADIRTYPRQNYGGLLLFRLRTTARDSVLGFVRKHLPDLLQMDFKGHLVVISETGIRLR